MLVSGCHCLSLLITDDYRLYLLILTITRSRYLVLITIDGYPLVRMIDCNRLLLILTT